ncbi:18071_t:CDS:2 [Funneliformis geosporum]|uniref:18071_t:CDS:1 n=1 Tax=Funneliformis geosporum TaxID=1117311 RepID=A0A9W4SDH3_9GLOM|nr:18071_t:CDS:2 [Funneliformis geosporum]
MDVQTTMMTKNPPDLTGLQNSVVQSFKYFSEIQQLKIVGNVNQEILNKISEERNNFRDFAEESINHSLLMKTHASDLVTFAECCEDKSISDVELLEFLRSCLDDAKSNKEISISLNDKLKGIRNRLGDVNNEKTMEKQKNLSKKISEADKVTDNAMSWVVAAVAAAPFTGGASLAAVTVAEAIAEAIVLIVSTTVAGASAIRSSFLNKLKTILPEIKKNLDNIDMMLSQFESYWEIQIAEIDDIINKLESNKNNSNGKRMIKPVARAISKKAKSIQEDSHIYSKFMRDAVNADKIGRKLCN